MGKAAGGAMIPGARTTSNATVEEVLGALSLLLNGGGISQIHTITTQLNAALAGNQPQIRALFVNLHTFLANLDAHKQAIKSALDGLAALSATLAAPERPIVHVPHTPHPGL